MVQSSTVEHSRDALFASIAASMRQGPGKSETTMNSENLHGLLGTGECIRYYPPNIETVQDPEAIFRNDREIDLYLHIPFCKTPCGFCPFHQYLYQEHEVRSYLSAIEKEIQFGSREGIHNRSHAHIELDASWGYRFAPDKQYSFCESAPSARTEKRRLLKCGTHG